MRDEFIANSSTAATDGYAFDSHSSQGLTRSQKDESKESSFKSGGIDRSASLTLMAKKGMKLKAKANANDMSFREVSERRQVGDAQSIMDESSSGGRGPWWRNVTMEEGM